MAEIFIDGDPGPEIRRKLNNMWADWLQALEEAVGPKGWSPVFGVASDGSRRVFQIVDWVGGEGDKPVLTGYVGASGIVPTIGDAIDVRGTQGIQGLKGDQGDEGPKGDQGDQGLKGDTGPANSLSIGTVQDGPTADATITGTAPSQTLNLTLPKGDQGDVGPKGDKGDQGDVGPKGDKGDQGDVGPKGDKGDQGDVGPKGDKGDTGDTGPKGDTGNAAWTPVYTAVADGERRVLRIDDWTGGQGTKPATGYLGVSGIVVNIGDALDIRGAPGEGSVSSVNSVEPDGAGNVELGIGDIPGLDGALADKVDKVTGYGLSQANYTVAEKSKLSDIAENATANTGTAADVDVVTAPDDTTAGRAMTVGYMGLGNVQAVGPTVTDWDTLTTPTGFVYSASGALNVPAGYEAAQILGINYLSNSAGFQLLNPIHTADTLFFRPRRSSVFRDWKEVSFVGHTHTAAQVSGLATVATSGSYDDLSNKPSIPTLPTTVTQSEAEAGTATTVRGWTSQRVRQNVAAYAQPALVSGTNIKTVNGESLLGSGNLAVGGDSFETGDVIITSRILNAPEWLPCDGSVYLQSSYPDLFDLLGVLYGPDGFDLKTSANLSAPTFGNGIWMARRQSPPEIITSIDGDNWSSGGAVGFSPLAFAFGDGVWVAIGPSGNLATSSDNGATWTPRDSKFDTSRINDVAYANGMWVICGAQGKVATSPDGTAWTLRDVGVGASDLNAVSYGGGIWVASGLGRASTSTDGISWTFHGTAATVFSLNSITYGGGLFVGVGGASSNPRIATSLNGVNWTERLNPLGGNALQSVGFANGLFVTAGTSGEIGVSTDGLNWVRRLVSSFSGTASGVDFGGGDWIVGAGSAGYLKTVPPYDPDDFFAVPEITPPSRIGGVISYIKT